MTTSQSRKRKEDVECSYYAHSVVPFNGFFTVTLTSDKSLSTLVIGGTSYSIAFYMSMFYIHFTTVFAITNVVEKSDRGKRLFTLFVYWGENKTSVRLGAPKPV